MIPPMNTSSPPSLPSLLRGSILRILTLAFVFMLAGCTARTPGRETAALSGQLSAADTANASARADVTFIRSNLSRADGKATVILRWLDQHRTPPDYLRPAPEVRRAAWSTPR